MPRQFAVVVAILSIAATHQADAQSSAPPVRDAGMSVVIRCKDCGTIESIREGQEARAVSPPGTASASPIGLVMYIPLGRKTGTDDAYVGSVGTHQWQERTANTRYEFTVRIGIGRKTIHTKRGRANCVRFEAIEHQTNSHEWLATQGYQEIYGPNSYDTLRSSRSMAVNVSRDAICQTASACSRTAATCWSVVKCAKVCSKRIFTAGLFVDDCRMVSNAPLTSREKWIGRWRTCTMPSSLRKLPSISGAAANFRVLSPIQSMQ
jgi:hypothetical protein